VTIFVDTSALYALLDEDDRNHRKAADLWAATVPTAYLATHAYVVIETSALVQRRLGMGAVGQLHDGLLAAVETAPIDLTTHHVAVTRWLGSGVRHLSLVDVTSFVFMSQAGIDRALAFDDDFIDAGFELVR